MLLEKLLKMPGFIYEINGIHYYLGKWICKPCTDTAATDCVMMYQMCRKGKEEPDTNIYFQKIRAYSDFALEVPYDPTKIHDDMDSLLESLSSEEESCLNLQIQNVEDDMTKYCS